jgi:hypothetical protein
LRVIATLIAIPTIILALAYVDGGLGEVARVGGIVTATGEGAGSRHAPGRGYWVRVRLADGVVLTCNAPAGVPIGSHFAALRSSSKILGRTTYEC